MLIDADKLKKFLRDQQNEFAHDLPQSEYTGAVDALASVDAEITSGRLSPNPSPDTGEDGLPNRRFAITESENNSKHLSCPFCGSDPAESPEGFIECSNDDCEASLLWFTQENWNTRASSPSAGGWIPDWLAEIGHKLRTQDNRITSDPLFCVFQKRRIWGIDPDHGTDWVWLQTDEGCEVDASEVELDEFGDPVNDIYQKCYYTEVDEFINAHLTDEAAKLYIHQNHYNLTKPFTYVTSQYRCHEYIKLRQWIMTIPPAPPQPDAEK